MSIDVTITEESLKLLEEWNKRTVKEFVEYIDNKYIGMIDNENTWKQLENEIKEYKEMRKHKGDIDSGLFVYEMGEENS